MCFVFPSCESTVLVIYRIYSLFFETILSKEQDMGPFLAGVSVYRTNESASGCALLGRGGPERLAVAAMFVSTHSSGVPREFQSVSAKS